MAIDLHDTIAAVGSPPGPAARGMIRISGPATVSVLQAIFVPAANCAAWQDARVPRRFSGSLQIPALGIPLPVHLMYWPTIRSYTGQTQAELHMTGSPPLLDAALERVFCCGARPATRGEFTLRAWLAGRIDLLQAEAVLGVIQATDHAELQRALGQLSGGVTNRVSSVRADLLALLSDLEAGLDFVDEDIEFVSLQEIRRRLDSCTVALRELCGDTALKLPSGWRRRVVLAGLPNAGKSTLFNRLVGRNAAIVSAQPGTTRDYLTATLRLHGLEIELVDTAGWETAYDPLTACAQQLRDEQTTSADLIVWCRSAVLTDDLAQLDDSLRQVLRQLLLNGGPQVLLVVTQCDLGGLLAKSGDADPDALLSTDTLQVSGLRGDGISRLEQVIRARLEAESGPKGELLGSTVARCRDSLSRTQVALDSAVGLAASGSGDELIALELRGALHELAVLLGEVYTDDILDQIFSRFCIGK